MHNLSQELFKLVGILYTEMSLIEGIDNKYVYHYTSPDGFLGILDKAKVNLRFTKYDSLNDTKERLDILEYLEHYIEKKKKTINFSNNFLQRIKEIELNDEFFGTNYTEQFEIKNQICDTYICCFSLKNDLLPMWNYYSKSNKYEGYSIGFSSDSFYSCTPGYELKLQKVIYTEYEKEEIFDKIFLPANKIYDKVEDDEKEMIFRVLQTYVNEYQFLFKNEHFSHEEEVRAILKITKDFQENDELSEKKYRNSNGYIVPYREFSLCYESVSSITIAPLLEKELARNNLNEFLLDRNAEKIKILSSNVPIRF